VKWLRSNLVPCWCSDVTFRDNVTATYRVQLGPDCDLDALSEVVPYLAQLGISHLYCSSYLQAAPGSTHGYDVVDHTRVSADLGGPAALGRLTEVLADHNMGHILDVIPNHMAIGTRASKWWWDVLKNGPESPFARFFDIDWNPPDRRLTGKILVPVLGDHYGRVLEAGELQLVESGDELVVRYYDHEAPIAPGSRDQLPGSGSLDVINKEPALLHLLLENQHFRLAYWRTDLELNYRRFFDINELVALRMEEADVFEQVHAVALSLVAGGRLTGLRIDHIDGLKNPGKYLRDLRARAPDTYIVVEKILAPDEDLPDWPVEGTTGYDWLNRVLAVLIDPDGEKPLSDLYTNFTGEISELGVLTHQKKLKVMDELLASDIERLVALLTEVCERHPRHRDYTRHDLRAALRGVIAELDVYRTYIDAATRTVRSNDAHRIETAIAAAQERNPELDPDLLDFLGSVLLVRFEGAPESEFVMRWQQTTGAVMAKAVEDTLFYNYNRMIALNEVGGNPGSWALSVDDFHAANARSVELWPQSMLSTSTHDTKRSEDVRARLLLLSEIPDAWAEAVKAWADHNEVHKRSELPDRNTEYLLYQTLVGAYPLDVERAVAYMHKAASEAKRFTSWIAPDAAYEHALERFVRAVLADNVFVASLASFVHQLVAPGRIKSLAMLLLKLTCPGVPDTYQGNEIWDLSLVDPDNRRPVNYVRRRELLSVITGAGADDVWARADSGAPKMFLLQRALELRRRWPGAFTRAGGYEPLKVDGPDADAFIGFQRGGRVAVVVPRFVMRDDFDAHIRLPEGPWRDVLTTEDRSGRIGLSDLLTRFPVALLERALPE
jgi:(1->4)-alpha-D-glucan 1-alpha-D-glucosylmutase